MTASQVDFSVFTKPWKMPIPELGAHVRQLGFAGIELPVRPGYPVPPEDVTKGLPAAVRTLADLGITIRSVAGPTDEPTMAACAECSIPFIRIMAGIGDAGYAAAEQRIQRELDALIPLTERYGVTIGIQNHCGRDVCNAMGLWRLVHSYDPKSVCAIWDAAHNALQGEEPELAIEIIWSHLRMVNLKNSFWERTSAPGADEPSWRPYWTAGRDGLASWPRAARELASRAYAGTVCLTAEYTDEHAVDRLVAADLVYARGLFGGAGFACR